MAHPTRTWSKRSQKVYDTLDPRLQKIVTRLRDEVGDLSLISGFRTKDEQDDLVELGLSQVRWPCSKHNENPSKAVDIQPYPYSNRSVKVWAGLGYLAGHAQRMAIEEGFKLRWGGDWNGNGDLTDQTFDDLFHLEIVE